MNIDSYRNTTSVLKGMGRKIVIPQKSAGNTKGNTENKKTYEDRMDSFANHLTKEHEKNKST